MSAPSPGLADRLVDWMAANRGSLDALMTHEGSRAIHEEFILAEGGTLPDRGTRIARARAASARAWMRHLAQALSANWPEAPPDLPERLTVWMDANRERLEAMVGTASRRARGTGQLWQRQLPHPSVVTHPPSAPGAVPRIGGEYLRTILGSTPGVLRVRSLGDEIPGRPGARSRSQRRCGTRCGV